jgi:drug/metabolite transporter superfamily protein YnfA
VLHLIPLPSLRCFSPCPCVCPAQRQTANPQAFHILYHTDHPVLLGAPTGSGKTISAELCMLRCFSQYPGQKVRTRALAHPRAQSPLLECPVQLPLLAACRKPMPGARAAQLPLRGGVSCSHPAALGALASLPHCYSVAPALRPLPSPAQVIYVAPLKALVRERIKDWGQGFCKALNKRMVELTGDYTPDMVRGRLYAAYVEVLMLKCLHWGACVGALGFVCWDCIPDMVRQRLQLRAACICVQQAGGHQRWPSCAAREATMCC